MVIVITTLQNIFGAKTDFHPVGSLARGINVISCFQIASSTSLRLEMNAEDDLYDAKLLPPDRDPSTSITESIECPVSEFPSAKDAENTEKDGGWAWVVCGAAFCDLFVVLGMHYTVGVLYAALLDHFKESKAKTGMSTYLVCFRGKRISTLICKCGSRRIVDYGKI